MRSKQWWVTVLWLLATSCAGFGSSYAASDAGGERLLQALSTSAEVQLFHRLSDTGLLLEDDQQQRLWSKSADQHFIPASTTKLITALLALEYWGGEHRFKTAFYLTQEKGEDVLWVKGFGDPFLVSEELLLIVQQLRQRMQQQGVSGIDRLRLDVGYYQSGLRLPGSGNSENPYDAIPSALAANFNTIFVRKTAQGIESAEPQTPLTPLAKTLARQIKQFDKAGNGLQQRVNIGENPHVAQHYFAELLLAFLQPESASKVPVEWRTVPNGILSEPLYVHQNSRTLSDVILPMMKYSTNYIANQIAINLVTEIRQHQVKAEDVAKTYRQLLAQRFSWQEFIIQEGAGLSRENQLTSSQLMMVLKAFQPWRHLLPEVVEGVYAKSGTLIGVSTLAGYIHKDARWYPFVFMINEKVPYRYRNKLAKAIRDKL